MSKNAIDEILLYSQLNHGDSLGSGENEYPRQTLDDLNAFLESKFADRPEVLVRIENLPGDLEKRAAQSMLNDGKSLEDIADWLEEQGNKVAYRDAARDAKAAASTASQTLQELGWDERIAQRMAAGHSGMSMNAFRAKLDEIDTPETEQSFDFREHGEMAAIRFHLDIPPEGISLYEAYESMVITDEWSDGQVQELDVVRHIQEVEAGVEPSQSGFAIEFAAKLRAAIDSGADPDMQLEDAMQLRDIMAAFEPEPASVSEATLERMRNFEQKAQEMLNDAGTPALPPKFEM